MAFSVPSKRLNSLYLSLLSDAVVLREMEKRRREREIARLFWREYKKRGGLYGLKIT
jgi:hypothetical protein